MKATYWAENFSYKYVENASKIYFFFLTLNYNSPTSLPWRSAGDKLNTFSYENNKNDIIKWYIFLIRKLSRNFQPQAVTGGLQN